VRRWRLIRVSVPCAGPAATTRAKTHLLNIYAKLGVSDRAAAVAEAFNRGLLTPATPERP
jgi:hypothetical protein